MLQRRPLITRRLRPSVIFLPVLLLLPCGGQAQEISGELLGRVVDASGLPLSDVVVTVATDGRPDRSALTGARGDFRVTGLTVGTYEVRFERIGMQPLVIEAVRVRLGATNSLGEVPMQVEAVGVEPLTVRASPFGIDPTGTDVGSRIDATVSSALPTGRDAVDLVTLLPQANESFHGDPVNIGGSTGLANQYFIDGANVTDGFRGNGGTNLPFNFVEAVELKQGGYEAEYGQAIGGLVNLVTKSGTNDFRFDAFGYFSGNSLSADPKPVPGTLDADAFFDYDLGVSVSGPLVRDRLWYIAAYNPRFENADLTLERFGIQDDRVTRHSFATKIDWQPADRSSVSLSVFGDPTSTEVVMPPQGGVVLETIDSALQSGDQGSVNASLNASTWVGDGWLLEGTAGYHDRDESLVGRTEAGRSEPFLWDHTDPGGTIVQSGGVGATNEVTTSRMFFKGAGTRFAGAHELKFGVEFQDNRNVWRSKGLFIDKFAEDFWTFFSREADATVHNRVASVFLQDSWAASRRLRLNLGLRWDGQWIDGGEGGTLQPITDQWQPRLGIVFEPGELGTQKIFGYVGRFYQQLGTFMPSLEYTTGNNTTFATYSDDPRTNPGSLIESIVFQDPDSPEAPRIDGLRGEHLDEFVLGYERLLGSTFKLVLRGVHRVLRDNIQVAFNPDPPPPGVVGNRGQGQLSGFEAADRRYWAGEFTLQHEGESATMLASYVLSRHHGNYQGLVQSEVTQTGGGPLGPNNNQTTWILAQDVNNRGLLPNDRTHVLKLSGAYRFGFGLTGGAFFSVASGTPLSEYQNANVGFFLPLFLSERGTAGRTATIWDLSFRFGYDLPTDLGGRLVLDLLHVGDPQIAVDQDQLRFRNSFCDDGQGGVGLCTPFSTHAEFVAGAADPNPRFGQATRFQPPFTVRLGFQLALGGR